MILKKSADNKNKNIPVFNKYKAEDKNVLLKDNRQRLQWD